jgi:integrase
MRGIQPGSKRSAASVRQIFIHLQAILDKAGPPGRRNRDAAGIIACPPYLKPPRITYKLPRIVPLDDLRDVYLAAVAMDIPRIPGIKPPAWWQALIVVALDTGLRRGDLLSLGMADIRWEELLIEIHQHKTGVGNLIPLHPVALKHLLAIRTDRRLVFEWPFGRTHFHTCLHRLQSAAGLPENRHFGLHAIRRTHATLMWQKNPEAARLVLGHGSDRTTRWHYVLGEGIVREAINALPQPWGLGEAV